MTRVLAPSVMCADLGNLRAEISDLDAAGVDMYHMDIMDGEFVPNFALSWADFATVRALTNKPMDAHLMVKNPAIHIPFALKYGADIIYVHYEAGNAAQNLQTIRTAGKQSGLAINPETSLAQIVTLLPLVDWLLVMRVNPGFAGQSAVPLVEDKILQLTEMENRTFKIALDGSVSPELMQKWSAAGIEGFVCGTASGMFGTKRNGRSYAEMVSNLKVR